MLKGPLEWLGDFPDAGWHLTAQQLRELSSGGRPFAPQRWLAASCHSAQELTLAAQMGVDFVTLSPVQATATHPEAQPLGWDAAREMWVPRELEVAERKQLAVDQDTMPLGDMSGR